jgi:hypothetical protein
VRFSLHKTDAFCCSGPMLKILKEGQEVTLDDGTVVSDFKRVIVET